MTASKTELAIHPEERNLVDDRMLLASRFAECLRRLSASADRLGMQDLAEALGDVSRCLDRMAYDIAVADCGSLILGRAARLVGIVENVVAAKERLAGLH
ncbi:hypothetical protein HJB86_28170 [Rhizobium sp. NZLR3b]|uniref:hypothetical protein n=1 Tax=Rhizobium sp. NZLR3b TaxID=2731101 RepID=UPI001C83F876|nr:hypothetical protein [Rhizobium sp. NZLR3b]MBX5192715.1 hypothetical protein [Rhizobium sp. NZLR3b]